MTGCLLYCRMLFNSAHGFSSINMHYIQTAEFIANGEEIGYKTVTDKYVNISTNIPIKSTMKNQDTRLQFQYRGQWFLPTHSDDKITGTLRFDSENEAKLELIGKFKSLDTVPKSVVLIQGIATNGLLITLYKCFCLSIKDGLNGNYESDWSISVVLTGAHFDKKDDMEFNKASASLVNLAQWLDVSGFSKITVNTSQSEFDIKYKLPELINFSLKDGVSMGFEFFMSWPRFEWSKLNFQQTSRFFIEDKQTALPLDEILEYMASFADFLTFATFQPTSFQTFYVETQKLVFPESKNNTPMPIKVFFVNRVPLLKNFGQPHFFLFRFKDINLQMLQKWFVEKDILQPVVDLLGDYLCYPNKFNEGVFLRIAQAVETFHRRKRGGSDLTEAEHQQRLLTVLEAIPEEHREFVEGKLKNSNEPYLRKRLEALLGEFNTPVLNKVIPEIKAFCQKVVDKRNYYTHYDKRIQPLTSDRSLLFSLTEKLKLLLVYCLLCEIGFLKEQVDGQVSGCLNRFCRSLAPI